MRIKISLLIITFLLIFSACKKVDLNPDPISIPTHTLLLSKVYVNGTLSHEYTYNDSDLVIRAQGSDTVNYSYNNGLLESESFGDAVLSYVYNATGQVIQTKFITSQTADIEYSDFIYDSLNLKEIISFNTTELGFIDYTYDKNGNISRETLYQYPDILIDRVTYTYDTKHNPYKGLGSLPGINTNTYNIVKEVRTLPDTVLITNSTYEYNKYDFPSTKNGNTLFTYKIIVK